MRCHRQPRRRASRHANPISDKQMVGGSRSVTIDVAALPHVRAGVRQPLTSSTVDGATTNGGHAIHCGPALARTTALRRTAALGRQQLAGTGRPSAAVRSPRSPVPKLPLSSAKRSAALPLCRRRLSQTGGRRCSDRRATSDQPDPAGVERVRLACSAVTTLTGTPSRSMR